MPKNGIKVKLSLALFSFFVSTIYLLTLLLVWKFVLVTIGLIIGLAINGTILIAGKIVISLYR